MTAAPNPFVAPAQPSTFNQNPPPDDGSQVVSNIVSWNGGGGTAGVLAKIGTPLQTWINNVITACTSLGAAVVTTTADVYNAMAGALAFTESTLTIAAASITPTRSAHAVNTSGGSPSDIVSTIATTGVVDGTILQLRRGTSGQIVTVKHGINNVFLSGQQDFVLQADADFLLLRLRGPNWYQIGGSYVPTPSSSGTAPPVTFYQPIVDIEYLNAINNVR